jgi:hypothetical protein
MPKKKKSTTKKKSVAKSKKPVIKKKAVKSKKPAPKKVAKPKKPAPKKAAGRKAAPRSPRRTSSSPNEALPMIKGPGAGSGGQSGDIEGLSDVESADSESVEELVEEGQDYEAELVSAVENAPDPDEGELSTEVPEDDLDPDAGSFSKRNRL